MRSKVILALANIASQGRYQVTPEEARHMNAIFEKVAEIINELEAEEAAGKDEEFPDGKYEGVK